MPKRTASLLAKLVNEAKAVLQSPEATLVSLQPTRERIMTCHAALHAIDVQIEPFHLVEFLESEFETMLYTLYENEAANAKASLKKHSDC